MPRGRLPLGVLVPIALVLLVGALAVLQYRWLDQVSQAERAQLRASLSQRARAFAQEFDREIGQVYTALAGDGGDLSAGHYDKFAAQYDAWREHARFPALVKDVYYVDVDRIDRLLEFSTERRVFEPTAWPESMTTIRTRLAPLRSQATAGAADGTKAALSRERVTLPTFPILSDVPAVLIQLPMMSHQPMVAPLAPIPRPVGADPAARIGNIIVSLRARTYLVALLDKEHLRHEVLTDIVERHFPQRGAEGYRVSIVDSARKPVLSRHLAAGQVIDPARADVAMPFFGMTVDVGRENGFGRVMAWSVSGNRVDSSPEVRDNMPLVNEFSVFVDDRNQQAASSDIVHAMALTATGWTLLLQHADGSLEAAVANARTRNLWLSFSILSVLGLSVGLIVLNARRSERLAAQQMDFVATVSHELRTPLAVIRSAAQNLSAGVVHDPDGARRYGDLIDTEGRRLTDMVEQVLEYAGLSGQRRPPRAQPVDVAPLIEDVVASSGPLVGASDYEVEVTIADDVPQVLADADAIRRALANLVTNAIKHGGDGRWVGISARRGLGRGRQEVEIAVTDRGRGIDADDLPHVFEPFYRGRYALERQVQGSGLGLSLVRRIALAAEGRVTVKSAPGAGTTFTLHLPAASPEARTEALPVPAPDAPGHAG